MVANETPEASPVALRMPVLMWITLGFAGILMGITFYSGLEGMVTVWNVKEEYGYGYLIPPLTAFLIWQRKEILEQIPFQSSWPGMIVVLAGVLLFVLGELSALYVIVQYAFLLTLYGVILSLVGWNIFRKIWVPLLFLVFMVPLPNFIYQGLSAELQLISSELGVAIIRLFGISVYLEGNVIDLGAYQLQVVEACSGLRYLFPLLTLSFIAAYLFRVAFWKRALIFVSCVPITIIMNSFRIGVIGVLVEKWGPGQAEGFLHYFEGWVIFMACMVLLLIEMWVLTKIGGKNESLGELFVIDLPPPASADVQLQDRKTPYTMFGAIVVLLSALGASGFLGERTEIPPDRESFSSFPAEVNGWESKYGSLEPIILDALKLDDYMIGNFSSDDRHVNFYVAYYASQSKGESAHSPRSCIPGGGWVISDLDQKAIDGVVAGGVPLVVNRLVIQKGDYRQLVYYWFQGRGRVITSEYMVKWFLFWDALTNNRTDGALVRLTTLIQSGESIDAGDERLESFAKDVVQRLDVYIPQ